MNSRFKKRKNSLMLLLQGLLSKNPLLLGGLVLSPAIVAGTSLKNAVAILIVMAFVTIPTFVLTSFLPSKIPSYLKLIICVLMASIFYMPGVYIVEHYISSAVVYNLGIYLPILVFNGILTVRAQRRSFHGNFFYALVDVFCHVAGFGIVICLFSAFREILGNGTIWEVKLGLPTTPALLYPFCGFLLLALLMAFNQQMNKLLLRAHDKVEEKRKLKLQKNRGGQIL